MVLWMVFSTLINIIVGNRVCWKYAINKLENLDILAIVSSWLRPNDLTLNTEKLLRSEIYFLGYELVEVGIRPGKNEINAVPVPQDIRLRHFLGYQSSAKNNYSILCGKIYSINENELVSNHFSPYLTNEIKWTMMLFLRTLIIGNCYNASVISTIITEDCTFYV